MKEISVKFRISEQQEEALLELLPYWRQYKNETDGSTPFAEMTIEKLFEPIMTVGSTHTIWKHIKEEQFRQGMIKVEELIDYEEMTIAQRVEHRRQQAQKEGVCE